MKKEIPSGCKRVTFFFFFFGCLNKAKKISINKGRKEGRKDGRRGGKRRGRKEERKILGIIY